MYVTANLVIRVIGQGQAPHADPLSRLTFHLLRLTVHVQKGVSPLGPPYVEGLSTMYDMTEATGPH